MHEIARYATSISTQENVPAPLSLTTITLAAPDGAGSDLVLLLLQDILGTRDRVNVPGTVGAGNWTYRLPKPIETMAADRSVKAALARLGVSSEVVVWDDPAVVWSRFAQVVVRSAWDYPARRGSFLAWAGRVAGVASLHNPLAVLRWTTDKRYLADLAAAKVAIVPTRWCLPGKAPEFPAGGFVVKPSVGAGSVGAARFTADEHAAAAAHVARLHAAAQVAVIQPYLAGVEAHREAAE